MSSDAVGQLRSIAKTVRQLPTFYQVRGSIADHYFLIVDKGAAFIREAESLGAFQGDSIYEQIGEKLAHPSCHLDEMIPIAARTVPAWKLTVWYAVVDTIEPELIGIPSRSFVRDANGNYSMRFDTSQAEAEIVARAIEAEADRLEAQIKADKGKELEKLVRDISKAAGKKTDGMKWWQVRDALLKKKKNGDRYTTRADLAAAIGCSSSTVQRAFAETPELREWENPAGTSGQFGESLDAATLDNLQTREHDPSDVWEPEDIDALTEYLKECAGTPEEREHIENMPPENRRQLAELVENDPDKSEQFWRWRKGRRKPRN